MDKLRLSYFVLDGNVLEGNEFPDFPGATIVYEVIRLTDGVFLFLDDHLDRFFESFALKKLNPQPAREEIIEILRKVLEINNTRTGNVKLIAAFGSNNCKLMAGFVPHCYPTEQMYEEGVETVSLTALRPDPNAKILHSDLSAKVADTLKSTRAYEVVYIDDKGFITEGSKSNLFFIRGNDVFTAPANKVLKGITRKYVIQACEAAGLNVREEAVAFNQIGHFESMLITGTSPKVLPARTLNSHIFATQSKTVQHIMEEYRCIFDSYIAENKSYLKI
jgi:branched-chain amino acid aminotransferase